MRPWPLLALLCACSETTSGLPQTDAGRDVGGGDVGELQADLGVVDVGAVICTGLSKAECQAAPGCITADCGCNGAEDYVGCFLPGDAIPQCDPCPPPCVGLNEQDCMFSNADCETHYCPDCDQNQRFLACTLRGDPAPDCPPVACPCDGLDEAACIAEVDCHRVFSAEEQPCACPVLGCCIRFERCAGGTYADCGGENLACRQAEPFCEGPYVVSFVGDCYEGCAEQSECAP